MNKLISKTAACASVFALCVFAGCSPQEQKEAANSAEKGLDNAGNAVSKGLDRAADVISDASLTGTVKTKLAATKGISATDIDVTTVNNVVTLQGKVPTAAAKNLAGQLAKDTPNVKGVNNKLVVGK